MKTVLYIILSITVIMASGLTDTTREKFNWTEQIVPITFLAAGVGLTFGTAKYTLQDKMPNTSNHIEDFIQYAPIVELYTANIFLKEHQNSVWDESKYLVIAELSNALIVRGLKYATNVERPNGSNHHSFPSGHTSQAFVGATVLYHEYKESTPVLAYSGYLFATTTAILRVTNNKHWVPDVLAGAGIGMIVTNLVYYFKPLKNWQPFHKKDSAFSFTPTLNFASVENWQAGVVVKF